jgi:ABC-type lipoprotein export system ATPase subunit
MSEAVLQTRGLMRSFTQGGVTIEVLRGVDLDVQPGEIVGLLGPSGSGKSTLLQAVGLLEGGFQGSIRIAGKEASALDDDGRTSLRRDALGFVYQFHHLLPDFDALENVLLPQIIHGAGAATARARAEELLGKLGLSQRLEHRPSKLSGGEQQRVAVAVANANEPRVLLADEPTGELDTATSDEIFAALRKANEDLGVTVVVVTHDALVSEQVQRTVRIRNGRTSTEVLRRVETGEDGVEALTAEEYAVLDRNGRLQLPAEYTEHLHMRKRVRLALESDHIGVWPDAAARQAKSEAESAGSDHATSGPTPEAQSDGNSGAGDGVSGQA